MLKKLLIVFLIFAVAIAIALVAFSHKAPGLLRDAIEKSLKKKVLIRDIEYHFPSMFELHGFEIKEDAPFEGETSFSVDSILLYVSPMSLSRKELIIDRVEVDGATIVLRKIKGKLFHAFSNAKKGEGVQDTSTNAQKRVASLPLEIHKFKLTNSSFKFMDYEVDPNGFVTVMDKIEAEIKDIAMPFSEQPTVYHLSARMTQGRDQKPALFIINGWTEFLTLDTEASFSLQAAYLPYFRPYYAQITQAAIQEGTLDTRAVIEIKDKELNGNIDFEIVGLLFERYENDNQLFGLKAEEILDFLKDTSGRLKLPIPIHWNMRDKSTGLKDILRKNIEKSLKNRVLGNVGGLLLKKLGEGTIEKTVNTGEDTLNRIKDLLKF